jgi:hypothetical protein
MNESYFSLKRSKSSKTNQSIPETIWEGEEDEDSGEFKQYNSALIISKKNM